MVPLIYYNTAINSQVRLFNYTSTATGALAEAIIFLLKFLYTTTHQGKDTSKVTPTYASTTMLRPEVYTSRTDIFVIAAQIND